MRLWVFGFDFVGCRGLRRWSWDEHDLGVGFIGCIDGL